jgi:MurNAc alpha-1-phosphate uridylyltransferase
MKALILAAGRGERMRPLSDALPKPMLAVGGKPLIIWQIERLRAAGIMELVVNTAWLPEPLHAAIGDGSALGAHITWQDEPPGAWETGGGIATALPLLGPEPFVVLSADIHTEFDYARLHAPARVIAAAPDTTCAHFVLVDNPPHHPHGDMALDVAGRIVRQGALLNYGNIGVFHPVMFTGKPARTRWKLFPWAYEWVERGFVSGEHFAGRWENIGTPDQLARLDHTLSKDPPSTRSQS